MKRLAIFALLLWCALAQASETVLLMTTTNTGSFNVGTTYYLPPVGAFHATAEADAVERLPPGTLQYLRCRVSAAPGAAKQWNFTVRVAAADTLLACVISGASATSCSDEAHTATVGSDPRVTISASSTASSTQSHTGACSMFFTRS